MNARMIVVLLLAAAISPAAHSSSPMPAIPVESVGSDVPGTTADQPVVARVPVPEHVREGQRLYDYWCAACHAPGPGHPGTQALDARYGGALPGALEDRTNLTPEFVEVFVRNGFSVMPFFRKTEINDAELAAIGAYLSYTPPEQAPSAPQEEESHDP